MNKIIFLTCCTGVLAALFALPAAGQPAADTLTRKLLGRWEMLSYSEQGVQVNKKAPALPQALMVYEHVRWQRARQWYGFYDADDFSRRENRAFEHWLERDSAIEVRRVAEAIAMPYFVTFFPDSTLSLYNKDAATGQVYFPEARQYVFSPEHRSIRIFMPGGFALQWHAQVLLLTADRMTLFLPEDAEVVELVKTNYAFP